MFKPSPDIQGEAVLDQVLILMLVPAHVHQPVLGGAVIPPGLEVKDHRDCTGGEPMLLVNHATYN